ncbi:MAG: carboxymuconolactone decarboxylase family protein [Pseudomonadota bacterium]
MTTTGITPTRFAGLCAAAALSIAVGGLAQAQAAPAATAAAADDTPVPKVFGKRFPPLTAADMTPEQKAMARSMARGPRGGLRGPASAYLRSPELGESLQKVGEVVRYRMTFPVGLRELAAAQVSRYMNSPYEWAAHSVQSVDGGIGKDTIEAIALHRHPPHMKPEEVAVYDFTEDLLQKHAVSDAHFKEVQSRWGDRGVMDLTGVIGYFVVVGMALNVDEHPAPPGANPLPRLAAR